VGVFILHSLTTCAKYHPNIREKIIYIQIQWHSTELRAGWSGTRVPAWPGNFSLHHRVQTGSGTHPASCLMSTRGSFSGSKAAGAWSWPPPLVSR